MRKTVLIDGVVLIVNPLLEKEIQIHPAHGFAYSLKIFGGCLPVSKSGITGIAVEALKKERITHHASQHVQYVSTFLVDDPDKDLERIGNILQIECAAAKILVEDQSTKFK